MARRAKAPIDHILEDLISIPWWANIIVGAVCWIGTTIAFALLPEKHLFQMFRGVWWVIPGFFGFTALASALHGLKNARKLQAIKSVRDLQAVGWEEFEHLTAAYYREKGYQVESTPRGPDGGIDLVMRREGRRILVQCKKYTREAVGVKAIREFFGVVIASGADQGIFVTTSGFTPEAMKFGLEQACLELIPGTRFAQMVQHLRTGIPTRTVVPLPPEPVSDDKDQRPYCPKCQNRMVRRIARKGENAGNEFWGCPNFPGCRGVRAS